LLRDNLAPSAILLVVDLQSNQGWAGWILLEFCQCQWLVVVIKDNIFNAKLLCACGPACLWLCVFPDTQ